MTRVFPSRFALLLAMVCTPGCKDDIEPPPADDRPVKRREPALKSMEIDPHHSITFKGDRTITIPNLVFVLQNDTSMPESFGITLTCTRPAGDGARMTLGKFEVAKNEDELLKNPIAFASGLTLDPTGNGVFTQTTAYQPKFVTLKIAAIENQEVRGTIGGEFNRFSVALATGRPMVVQMEGSFVATLVRK